MKRKVITILSILCIAALCIGTAVAISSSHKIKLNPDYVVGNTAGNLYNGGTFCEDDEYVYFSNAYDNGALYRMRPDESDMKKLVSTQVSSINSGGDYLYYYQQSMVQVKASATCSMQPASIVYPRKILPKTPAWIKYMEATSF